MGVSDPFSPSTIYGYSNSAPNTLSWLSYSLIARYIVSWGKGCGEVCQILGFRSVALTDKSLQSLDLIGQYGWVGDSKLTKACIDMIGQRDCMGDSSYLTGARVHGNTSMQAQGFQPKFTKHFSSREARCMHGIQGLGLTPRSY